MSQTRRRGSKKTSRAAIDNSSFAIRHLWFVLMWVTSVYPAIGDDHPDLPPSHSIEPELYATGFAFAEGPALDRGGNLFAVNYRELGNIGRIAADGTASIWCVLQKVAPLEGRRPQANGLKVGRFGRLIVADAGGGRLIRVAADGATAEVLADRYDGSRLRAVNDVALDAARNIYFTDPGGSSVDNPIGCVFRFDTANRLTQLDNELAFPTGVGITPDQKHLCVAESERFRILIYDLETDGSVTNRRVLIEFPEEDEGAIRGGKHFPDGLVFDEKGRLYVAMWTGRVINVVEVPSGKLIRQYSAGGNKATNCHFHGDYLYTTVVAKEAVFRLKLGVAGFDYRK